tara:strand:+ start:574 stop:978 length:405 start_codon:yes stop_codon:yes gene_type:complete
MKYDLSIKNDLNDFKFKINYLIENKKICELKAVKISRTSKQNSSLHKYFTFIADELNELGMEFNYFGVSGKQLSMRYTPNIVKDYFWRPIQVTLFDIESTTKLNTKQMNEIIDVITKFFAEKGVLIPFPSIECK